MQRQVKVKKMISISTQTASEYSVILEEKTDSMVERFTRRVSRSSTLDGGSVYTDSGYSDTDRTITLVADVTEEQQSVLKHIIQNYALITVATKDGCFTCRPKNFSLDNGEIRIIIWISE